LIEGYGIEGAYYTPKGSLLKPLAGGNMTLLGLVSAFFGWGLGLAANPQYTVRIIAAKDDKTAKKMIVYSVCVLSIIYIALLVIGLGSRVIRPSVESTHSIDALFPYVFNSQFPSIISGVVLLAIIAAAISTANSQLLVVSSSFVYDIYKLVKPRNGNDDGLLYLSRIIVFLAGSASLWLALSPPESLIIYGGYVWGIFSAAFFLPLYGGLFWKKATRNAAILSMLTGLMTMIVLMLKASKSQVLGEVNPALPSVMLATIVFICISLYEEKINEVDY